MQRQQREAEKAKEDEKTRRRKAEREKKKPLPNLAEAIKEDGVKSDPNESSKKISNQIEKSNKKLQETIESGNKKSEKISENTLDETKKTNNLLTRIIKSSSDSIKKGALETGNEGLENTKDVAKGSFGEFGLLAQNLVKTAYAAIKKVSKEEDDETERKGQKKKKLVEKIEEVPAKVESPVVEKAKEPEKAKPTIKTPIVPMPEPLPIHEIVQPHKVWNKRPEKQTAEKIQAKPVAESLAPLPIHEIDQPSKVWSKRPEKLERIKPEEAKPAIQRVMRARPQEVPQEAQKGPTVPSKIDRKGKSPQQVRIERMHRREGITPSAEPKDQPKLERMNRKQIKQQKLEEKKAAKENPPKELVEMNKSLEKLVKISEDQLKQSQSEELAKNSNELQASKPNKENITKVEAPKDDKKKGFLSGVLGGLFEGLLGSISSGKGLLGIIGGAISSVLGIAAKIVKPIGGFISGLAKSGKLIPIIGQVVTVITAIFDFFDGWKNAAEILGKDGKLLTLWDKFSAGIGSVLGGFVSIIDDVLGFFGIETKFGETIKKGVASFLGDLPNKISGMFDTILKGVDELTGGFASKYIEALKSFWTSALKGLLSVIPGGDKISSFLGLDKTDKTPSKAPEIVAAPKASSTFAPRAEANAAAIRADDRANAQQAGNTVVAPSSNTQVVNNNNYTSAPLTTRNNDDSHRYGLK